MCFSSNPLPHGPGQLSSSGGQPCVPILLRVVRLDDARIAQFQMDENEGVRTPSVHEQSAHQWRLVQLMNHRPRFASLPLVQIAHH